MLSVDRPTKHVARLRFDRASQRNAITLEGLEAFEDALAAADEAPEVRAIVVTGSGDAFSAGLDLSAMEDLEEDSGVEAGLRLQQAAVRGLLSPRRCATPVVAAMNGIVVGGALALALACDLRVCSSDATIVPGFQKLGLTGTDVGVSWLLPRVVGVSTAFDLMLTSRRLDAASALSCGLVSRVLDGPFDDAAVEVAEEIASLSPFAMQLTKQAMWANLAQPDLLAAIELENRNQVLALQTANHREGLAAMRQRRPAQFS